MGAILKRQETIRGENRHRMQRVVHSVQRSQEHTQAGEVDIVRYCDIITYCDSVILPGFNFLHQCKSCLTGVHMCMCIVQVKLIKSHSVIHELIFIDIDDS